MIAYDVATKVLDTEQFPQHNIAGLISGITFIFLFQSGKAFTMEGNAHTHTHTHAPTHYQEQLYMNVKLTREKYCQDIVIKKR